MHAKDSSRRLLLRTVAAVLVFCALPAAAAQVGDLDDQRRLFEQVYADAERGDWRPVENLTADERQLLQAYVLWPDLRAAWLRAKLKSIDAAEIDGFLSQYGTLRPARQLRYRYALTLARKGDLDGFQRIYEQFYQGQGNARLDCYSLQADIDAGQHARVPGRALDLWLTGTSQVEECDPVFDYLTDKQLLGPVEYRKRYALAVDAREFRLARWLAKSIDEEHVEAATRWIQAQAKPDGFLARHDTSLKSDTYREQLVYATERLTYRDPEAALRAWKNIEKHHGFTEEQELRTQRHIALWTARDNLPGAYRLLGKLPAAARDDEVLRWRARISLRDENWWSLVSAIRALPKSEREQEKWRYWEAIAYLHTGREEYAHGRLQALSAERSYYGFLAADEIGEDYAFESMTLPASEAALAEIAGKPGIVRARELFLVGLDSSGRSEWQAAIRYLDDEQKLQAAILADRWGWHSRAISTLASIGEYDDLAIRYPLPWKEQFEAYSSAANIETPWAYGIARSESLFMRDVRSSAGAIGLMQLMPNTGRMVAKQIRLQYAGLNTLTDPDSNIRLGTSYLGQMAERFGGHRVLATAAYNAGPHRVESWLPEKGTEDARVWIENIPFNETRKYVKRVLAAQAIFHWRMTGQQRRVSEELWQVPAPVETQLAAREAARLVVETLDVPATTLEQGAEFR
jgi:soluble lytic murein transglycosylase